jgi:dipeptide transport system ATP-binding protein
VSTVLAATDLAVAFRSEAGPVGAVEGVSFQLAEAETLAIVGESSSGKSVTALALMRLLGGPPGCVVRGRATLTRADGSALELLELPEARMAEVRGRDIAMIFQEPMTSLNPVHRVGDQIAEALQAHEPVGRRAAAARAVALLEQVGIPEPALRARAFPHLLSGGMRQRAMIAMALACRPRVLIADEPTTALDVTIQAQILDLLRELQKERGMALVLITHNMGVVSEMAQRIAVMYAGQVMEHQRVDRLFASPQHPYTEALLAALPERAAPEGRLATISGVVPGVHDRPSGCLFAPRCSYVTTRACNVRPALREWQGAEVRCHYPLGEPGRIVAIEQDRPRQLPVAEALP